MSRAGSVNHNKVIISSLHKADLLGVNSPGVGQYDTMQSSFKTGYSISKANRWKNNLKNRKNTLEPEEAMQYYKQG